MVNMIRIAIVILMIAVLGVISGCEEQSELKKSTKTPVVVSGKIMPPPPVKKNEKPIPQMQTTTPAKTEQAQALPKTDTQKIVQVPSGKDAEESSQNKQADDAVPSGKSEITQVVATYDSTGKLNPFLPLIQEKEDKGTGGLVVDEKPKRMLTPLEKMELSQIKLVAVILMEKRQLAMVEEASGKGYEVKIGTYMGKNNGQVSKINQSSIVVKEYVKDYKGKLQARFQEIKLQKKESGE
jgi:type IV pilus assembly protein PilP